MKDTFLKIARHWQLLAEELERAKDILGDEMGAIKLHTKKRRSKKTRSGKIGRKRKTPARVVKAKRSNGHDTWSLW